MNRAGRGGDRLIRYRRYGDDLVLFEQVNTPARQVITVDEGDDGVKPSGYKPGVYKTVSENLNQATPEVRDRFEALKAFLVALGDDVQVKTLKYCVAFQRIKNFACVELRNQAGIILVYVKVDPTAIEPVAGFTRDVRTIGHFGTGDLEIALRNDDDLERAKPLLEKSYEAS